MTANAMASDRQKCLAAGMNDHVAKPIDPDQLWRALAQWITPRADGTSVSSSNEQAVPDALLPPPAALSPPAAQSQGDAASLPRDIDGLDIETGLRHLLGRPALYLSVLQRFAADQAGAPAAIEHALRQGDTLSATRMAHTIKGVAGTVGAAALALRAGDLERAIAEPAPAWEPSLLSLKATFEPLMAALQAHFALDEPKHAAGASQSSSRASSMHGLEPSSIAALLDQLEALLEGDDPAAIECLEGAASALPGVLGDIYDLLAAAVRHFDFPKALALLRQWRASAAHSSSD
jgi:HPt (histidine-containing phosphotransfer) domain-containing protein